MPSAPLAGEGWLEGWLPGSCPASARLLPQLPPGRARAAPGRCVWQQRPTNRRRQRPRAAAAFARWGILPGPCSKRCGGLGAPCRDLWAGGAGSGGHRRWGTARSPPMARSCRQAPGRGKAFRCLPAPAVPCQQKAPRWSLPWS